MGFDYEWRTWWPGLDSLLIALCGCLEERLVIAKLAQIIYAFY